MRPSFSKGAELDKPDSADVARSQQDGAVLVETTGPCITSTIAALAEGVGSGRQMDTKALEKARAQAVLLLQDVVAAYESSVAENEVGLQGSGLASREPPIGGRCPTGLLYGRIQSGK